MAIISHVTGRMVAHCAKSAEKRQRTRRRTTTSSGRDDRKPQNQFQRVDGFGGRIPRAREFAPMKTQISKRKGGPTSQQPLVRYRAIVANTTAEAHKLILTGFPGLYGFSFLDRGYQSLSSAMVNLDCVVPNLSAGVWRNELPERGTSPM